jgi:spore coat polysaccharide biosynthesis protein SpsF
MVENKIGFIIQARLNSDRLPQKVLLPLPHGSPTTLLDQVILRAQKSKLNPQVIIATSTNPENQVLDNIAQKHKVNFYAGSEQDVLARFQAAALEYNLDTIVRLTADNPFIQADIIDQAVLAHLAQDYSYTTTAGLPLGCNIEVISKPALYQAFQEANLPEHREHVTPYIKQNPGLFRLHTLPFYQAGSGTWRLTVDNENDYALACLIYYLLYPKNIYFDLEMVAELVQQQPWIMYINRQNFQKQVFTNIAAEIQAGVDLLRQNDLPQAAKFLAKKLS